MTRHIINVRCFFFNICKHLFYLVCRCRRLYICCFCTVTYYVLIDSDFSDTDFGCFAFNFVVIKEDFGSDLEKIIDFVFAMDSCYHELLSLLSYHLGIFMSYPVSYVIVDLRFWYQFFFVITIKPLGSQGMGAQ